MIPPSSRLRLWSSRTRILACGLALFAGCAAVHGGAVDSTPDGSTNSVDVSVTQDQATSPDRSAELDMPMRGTLGDGSAKDSAAPSDGGVPCDDAGSCLVGCGNGKLDPGLDEACDDGNSKSGDGCSADCATVEKDYRCPQPGMACVYLVKCGDGKLGGKETCDDGNAKDADGCSAACVLESGWSCVQPGTDCVPRCGDGVLMSNEQCDPPNPGNGCSATCKIETGYICDPPPAVATPNQPSRCKKTMCGDGKKEGAEACDDTNLVDGDGCAATCALEPDCSTGTCASKCGDGMKLKPEACDDGNTRSGDGCSSTCTAEPGFLCTDKVSNPPTRLNLFVTYRDFISFPSGSAVKHPDFESFWGDDITPLLVKPTLGTTGKPVMDGRCVAAGQTAICPKGQELTTVANFDQWYRDVTGVNITIPSALLLPRLANGSYVYDSAKVGFYPIDKKGWTAAPVKENTAISEAGVNDGLAHNFGFTTEIRYFFQYQGGESLTFSGDDDVWIFVNRKLALDLGGLHPPVERILVVDQSAAALGLTIGGLYEIVLFHAERHSAGSNFKLTLTGFAPAASVCAPMCGDAIVIAPEQCDLGTEKNVGGYNGCTTDCRRGPSCGDGQVQSPDEQCDDGVNLTLYGAKGSPGCAPGCVDSGYCGDAKVDGLFGEQCDLGKDMNVGDYNGCSATCLLGPRCGDHQLQKDAGEECDDGGTVGGDGCTHDCKIEIIP